MWVDGHKMEDCTRDTRCLECHELKLIDNHLTCSMACPRFRKTLKELKDQFWVYHNANPTS